MNLINENEIQPVTTIEGLEKEKTLRTETHIDFSSDTNVHENEDIFSLLVKDASVVANNSMPQPQRSTTVKFFTNTSNTLRGVPEDMIVDKNEVMLAMKEMSGLDEKQLVKCHGKTSKETARSLIKFLYPNPEPKFSFSNIKKSVINSIINYTKYSNPYDTASDAEIRKSMNNYFTSLPRKNKTKTIHRPNQIAEESSNNNNIIPN
ncbi:unnamed protein product [Rotaria sordida]|uniref:Uncharacterized protein n=1 Tax=Rotaria sordida TaxID=392033 RepID=A0A815ABA0_9BILA|nr:unnamed protein product [Rotaria sordida]CAF3537332.1 unnamed protein product [Rotaria sordida]